MNNELRKHWPSEGQVDTRARNKNFTVSVLPKYKSYHRTDKT